MLVNVFESILPRLALITDKIFFSITKFPNLLGVLSVGLGFGIVAVECESPFGAGADVGADVGADAGAGGVPLLFEAGTGGVSLTSSSSSKSLSNQF